MWEYHSTPPIGNLLSSEQAQAMSGSDIITSDSDIN